MSELFYVAGFSIASGVFLGMVVRGAFGDSDGSEIRAYQEENGRGERGSREAQTSAL